MNGPHKDFARPGYTSTTMPKKSHGKSKPHGGPRRPTVVVVHGARPGQKGKGLFDLLGGLF